MNFYNRYETENFNFMEDRNFEDKKFEERSYNNNGNKDCCIKRVETYYCCPSYYTEEKKDKCDKKEEKHIAFYEGTFKLYPSYCDDRKDDNKYNNYHEYDKREKCNMKENDKHENNNRCCQRRCCLCNLFGNCRRW